MEEKWLEKLNKDENEIKTLNEFIKEKLQMEGLAKKWYELSEFQIWIKINQFELKLMVQAKTSFTEIQKEQESTNKCIYDTIEKKVKEILQHWSKNLSEVAKETQISLENVKKEWEHLVTSNISMINMEFKAIQMEKYIKAITPSNLEF